MMVQKLAYTVKCTFRSSFFMKNSILHPDLGFKTIPYTKENGTLNLLGSMVS
jgi:hypothetical protein